MTGTPVTFSVDLPWPAREMFPNSRCHWARKASKVKRARQQAAWSTKAAGYSRLAGRAAKATTTFYPPDARRRDSDGMFAACKAYFDGIADVIGIDDSLWSHSFRRAEIRKRGAVMIKIEVEA